MHRTTATAALVVVVGVAEASDTVVVVVEHGKGSTTEATKQAIAVVFPFLPKRKRQFFKILKRFVS